MRVIGPDEWTGDTAAAERSCQALRLGWPEIGRDVYQRDVFDIERFENNGLTLPVGLDEIDWPMSRKTCRVMEPIAAGFCLLIRPCHHHHAING